MKKNILLFFFYLCISFDALAYLDPASGSAILYIVLSFASAGLYFFKDMGIKIYYVISSKLRGEKLSKNLEHEIVFYSEGRQYWNVFSSVIDELLKKKKRILFLTSDKRDPAFEKQSENFVVNYIGDTNIAGIYLKQIRAKFLAMTTPQLDVLTIKRSKKIKHYAHIVHAPVDVGTYRKFAFDYFDSVFCSGPHQITSIRFFEEKRNTPKKLLLETGCTYYDDMILKHQTQDKMNSALPTILIAPTWKNYSIIHDGIHTLIDTLLNSKKFNIILRPHPQTYVSFPEVMKEIESKFNKDERFEIDQESSAQKSLSKADLLISDLSGIIWDFVFLHEKPVVLIQKEMNFDGFELTEMPFQNWDFASLDKVGRKVEISEIKGIDVILEDMLKNPGNLNLSDFRNKSVYNWGKAGQIAADQIISIINTH